MIEKGKISSFQMGLMMYLTILAGAILTIPASTGKYAKQDLWLSPIWAIPVGLLLVFICIQLNKLYPKMNIIQYSEQIIGKYAGKVLGVIFLFFFLHNSAMFLRGYVEFIKSSFLPKTPIIVVLGGMVVVSSFAIYGGVEVLARATQVFFPLFILPILVVVVLLLPDMKISNIQPIMGNGIFPSLKGSIFPQAWFGDLLYMSFLLPFLEDREAGRKWTVISLMAVTLTMVITNLATVLVFNGTSWNLTYPVMALSKYVSTAGFFEHIESIIMAAWITGVFIKFSVFSYTLVLGMAQWLRVSNYKPFIFPVGLLQIIFSIWLAPSFQEFASFMSTSAIFYFFFIQFAIPLFLLLIAIIKRKFGDRNFLSLKR